jgi:hypothetical protein
MSTATTSVEVGQIRQDPRDDSFVVVLNASWSLSGRVGWSVRPVDRFGYRHGPYRWISGLTLNAWALIDPATITEPQ